MSTLQEEMDKAGIEMVQTCNANIPNRFYHVRHAHSKTQLLTRLLATLPEDQALKIPKSYASRAAIHHAAREHETRHGDGRLRVVTKPDHFLVTRWHIQEAENGDSA